MWTKICKGDGVHLKFVGIGKSVCIDKKTKFRQLTSISPITSTHSKKNGIDR